MYNTDPLKRCYFEKLPGGISAVEMLFRCNYVAVIAGGQNPAFPSNVGMHYKVISSLDLVVNS